MRSAYDRYRQATETLKTVTPAIPGDLCFRDSDLPVEDAAQQQRAAFESYIEARLELSEFMCLGGNQDPAKAVERVQPGPGGFRNIFSVASKPAAMVVAGALLFPALSLLHRQERRRDLDLLRAEMKEMVNQTGKRSSPAAMQLPASDVTQPANKQKASEIPPAQVQKTHGPAGWSNRTNVRKMVPARQREARRDYEFSVAPSGHFRRLGPIRLSVRNVDLRHRSVDVTVMAGDFTLDQKHVKINELVWIHGMNRARPVVLVVSRIDRNQVRGRLRVAELPAGKAS
jgi:hypothetical protein